MREGILRPPREVESDQRSERFRRGDFTPGKVLCGCHGVECVWLWDLARDKWVICYVWSLQGERIWDGKEKFYDRKSHQRHDTHSWMRWKRGERAAADPVRHLLHQTQKQANR